MQNELKGGRRRQTVLVLARRMCRGRMGQSQWRNVVRVQRQQLLGIMQENAMIYVNICEDMKIYTFYSEEKEIN